MPRFLRVEYPGACYHVINRGNYRRNIFEEAGAAEAFERTLGETAMRFGWKVHTYVIMRNHFHLAVQISEPNLSVGMKWLQGTWARRNNNFKHAMGRPFQGRYKALVAEPGHAFAQVCHYIHLNPVRASVVEPHELQTYRWSSLAKFEARNFPQWLDPVTVLFDAGQLANTAKGWLSYRSYLCFRSIEKSSPNELSRARFSRGWCIGRDQFRSQLEREFEDKGQTLAMVRLAGLEPGELAAEKEKLWLERLTTLAHTAKIELNRLPSKKSAREKTLLAAAMKLSTSASNGWLAAELNMGKAATVSQFVRRFLLVDEQKRQVETLLSRVKTRPQFVSCPQFVRALGPLRRI